MEIFGTKWKVLIPIFRRPTIGLTIREISRETKISHPTVSRIIKFFEKNEILNVDRRRREILVKGNFENKTFVELKKFYNIMSLKPFIKEITAMYPIDVIICFGSYSRGLDTENSDIDIYIGYQRIDIGEKIKEKFEKMLFRRIQIFSGDLKEFPRELAENIINGIKLYGWIKLW